MPASAIGVSLFVIIHPAVLARLKRICRAAAFGRCGQSISN
jgi:hypothetical protein